MKTDDPRFKALEWFKDWSNYLLVTSVAALGWIASDQFAWADPAWKRGSLWCLGASTVFGMLTLALIPLVAQQLTDEHKSIHGVRASFAVLGVPCHAYLTQACRPQHLLFMGGMVAYCIGKAGVGKAAGAVLVLSAILGVLSKPKK